jgi:hypothetical protein
MDRRTMKQKYDLHGSIFFPIGCKAHGLKRCINCKHLGVSAIHRRLLWMSAQGMLLQTISPLFVSEDRELLALRLILKRLDRS